MLVPFLFLIVAATAIRGADPSKSKLYKKNPFACLDGSNKNAVLNDDFCDCKDGSDEPSTSACYNGFFYCQNEGNVPVLISSRLVEDGVCDYQCCDGSDESSGKCPNVCEVQAINEANLAERTEYIRKLGAKAKLELYWKAKQIRLDKAAEVKRLQASLKESKSDLATQRKSLRELESKGSSGIGAIISGMIQKVIDTIGGGEEVLSLSNQEEQCTEDSSNQELCNVTKQNMKEIRNGIKTMESRIEELTKSLNMDSAGEEEAYYALRDSCLEYPVAPYTYRYCWFNDIKQNYLLLGSFDKESWIVKDGRMKFENGEKCYNGLIRHVIVQLVCSPEEKIISITEPNMCEYFMEIGTASFCEILPGDQEAEENHHNEL